MMDFLNKQHVGTARKGFFEAVYFRPDSKHLLHPFFWNKRWMYYFLHGFVIPVASIPFTAGLGCPLLCLRIPRVIDNLRLHNMQARYMKTGIVPPQVPQTLNSAYPLTRLWDDIEQRHRYRDDGWA